MLAWFYFTMLLVGVAILGLASAAGEATEAGGNALEAFDTALEGAGIDIIPDSWLAFQPGGIGCLPVTGGFLSFFGGIGLMATAYFRVSALASLFWAGGAGVIAGIAAIQFGKFVLSQQASAPVKPSDYEGAIGVVSARIPGNDLGSVTLNVAGITVRLAARSEDSEPIEQGVPVTVVRKEGNTVTVQVRR